MATGVETRHRAGCKVRPNGAGCTCTPSYRAVVFDKVTKKTTRRSFPTEAAAKSWRRDAYAKLGQGRGPTTTSVTLGEACDDWFRLARSGVVTTRSRDHYKPGALRAYEQNIRLRVPESLLARPFHAVRHVELQDLIDQLVADGHAAATVMGPITALRAVYKRAVQRGEIESNPTARLKLPSVRIAHKRFPTRWEAADLTAAVSATDRPLWETAFRAGLRRGELMALRWEDVDLKARVITVARGWDLEHGPQETKNRQRRKVPIPLELRDVLVRHKIAQAQGMDLCFGVAPGKPFHPQTVQERADAAWKDAGLTRLTFHDCRHAYASFSIDAGVNAKALCDFMGHSSIQVTYDRYGHLLPGGESEAAALLDEYFASPRPAAEAG